MTVYIFTGPTLAPHEAEEVIDASYLPPVSEGDVFRVAVRQPQAIGIIDGYFEHVPSVRHKEILWAMSQGIHVYGSASMGALRAAELAPFGMVGVGEIFEAYHEGLLEDDDEVAVVHGPPESGYQVASEALVNIRATLFAAEADGVLTPATRSELITCAKNLFYPQRSYHTLLQQAAAQGLPERELEALREWLPYGRINQKRQDALAMLSRMREHLATNPKPKVVRYSFQYTDMWDQARRYAGQLHLDRADRADMIRLNALLDELRLGGPAYVHACQGAMLRFLALEEAQRQGFVVTSETLRETVEAVRRQRGLLEPEDFDAWLEENELSQKDFIRLMEDETRIRWLTTVAEPEVAGHLVDHLRMSGEYTRLLARIRDKQRVLDGDGLRNLSLADAGVTEEELMHWYSDHHLHSSTGTDVASYSWLARFQDEDAFRRTVLDDYLYTMVRDKVEG